MAQERENRLNLAVCYHLVDYFKMSDIIWNHIPVEHLQRKILF